MEPGESHVTQRVTEAANFFVLQLSADWVQGIARQLGLRGTVHWQVPQIQSAALTRALLRFKEVDQSRNPLELESQLTAAVRALLLRWAEGKAPKEPSEQLSQTMRGAVKRARDYIFAHFDKTVRLEQLAQVVDARPFSLHRNFVRAYGIPPHEYQNQLQISQARRLLRRGERPSDVAIEVGFSSHSYFDRVFKNQVGVTPGQYRAGSA